MGRYSSNSGWNGCGSLKNLTGCVIFILFIVLLTSLDLKTDHPVLKPIFGAAIISILVLFFWTLTQGELVVPGKVVLLFDLYKLLSSWIGIPLFLLFFYVVAYTTYDVAIIKSNDLDISDFYRLNNTKMRHDLFPESLSEIFIYDKIKQHHDHSKLRKLFPINSDHKMVIAWGRDLFETYRAKYVTALSLAKMEYNMLEGTEINPWYLGGDPRSKGLNAGINLSPVTYLESWGAARVEQYEELKKMHVTDDLAAHIVWTRLNATPGVAEEDLFNLKEIVENESGSRNRMINLLSWAKSRVTQRQKQISFPDLDIKYNLRPSPPDLEWFYYWVIYDDYAIKDSLFERKKDYLFQYFGGKQKFGKSTWNALLNFGKVAAAERSKFGYPLPENSERSNLVAAVDRLSGLDPFYASKIENTILSIHSSAKYIGNDWSIWDLRSISHDIPILNESNFINMTPMLDSNWSYGDPYRIADLKMNYNTTEAKEDLSDTTKLGIVQLLFALILFAIMNSLLKNVIILLVLLLLGVSIFQGMRFWTIAFPSLIFGIRKNKNVISFSENSSKYLAYYIIFGVIMITVNGFFAYINVDNLSIILNHDFNVFMVAITGCTLFGGLVTESLINITTMIFIKLERYDACKFFNKWSDSISITLSISTLLWYQNSLNSIIAGTVLGFMSPHLLSIVQNSYNRQ